MHEFYYMFKRFIFMMLKDPYLQAIGLETWETLDKELHNKDLAQEIQRDLVTPIGAFCSYLLREYHFLVFCDFSNFRVSVKFDSAAEGEDSGLHIETARSGW